MLRRSFFLAIALLAGRQAVAQPATRWFLAEGATGSFFEEYILVGNPNAAPAQIRVTLQKPFGVPVVHTFTMPATSRATIRVNGIPGVEDSAVSAVVECTNQLEIVVERSMYWSNGTRRGGHNAAAVRSPSTTWLLAEGATGFFENFILLQNPDAAAAADVRVTYLKEDGSTVTQTVIVPAASRYTIWANTVPGVERAAFSTLVESRNSVGLIVERAMYWGQNWEGGHGSSGVTETATRWMFSEAFTGTAFGGTLDFDTFLLLANPGATAANVAVTFLRDAGGPLTRVYAVRPNSRLSVWTDQIAELTSAAFSMVVESTNGVPIVAERAVYWGAGGAANWVDGHNAPGLTSEAARWAFAEGAEDSVDGTDYDSYFLVANANAAPIQVRATFLREDGTGIVRTFSVAAQSRFTIHSGNYPALSNQRFATFLESERGELFTAERAVYWGAGYFGGHASAGTAWTGTIATPPAPPLPTVTGLSPASGPATGGTRVTISGANFSRGAAVTIGGQPATGVIVVSAGTISAVTPAHPAGPASVVVTTAGVAITSPTTFVYTTTAPLARITLTDTILAFGDSITQGITAAPVSLGTIWMPATVQTTGYPERLRQLLQARYATQTITVANQGVAGEYAAVTGRTRLPTTIQPSHDLVIILEGVNDTNAGVPGPEIADALRSMVRAAKAAGKRVILSTLTPVKANETSNFPPAELQRILDLNARIRVIAQEEGVVLVDMFEAFGLNISLLSADGLHPSESGYQRMAEVFFNAIVANFETLAVLTQ